MIAKLLKDLLRIGTITRSKNRQLFHADKYTDFVLEYYGVVVLGSSVQVFKCSKLQ